MALPLQAQCSIPVPNSMFNLSFTVKFQFYILLLDVQFQFPTFMFSLHFHALMVVPSSEAGDTLASLGRAFLASELNCHHNSQCLAHVSCTLFYFYFPFQSH